MCSKKLQEQLSADAELPAAVEVPTAVDPSEVETERSGHVVRCVSGGCQPQKGQMFGLYAIQCWQSSTFFFGGGWVYNII